MIEKLKSIIADVKEKPELVNELNANSSIMTEAGLTSLEMVTFIFRIEEEFDVEIDFDSFDYNTMESIQRFSDFISLLKTKGASVN